MVLCVDSSENDYSDSLEQKHYNNVHSLTLPELINIPKFNRGYSTTTVSPLIIQDGKYNPTTTSTIYVQNQQAYNPATSSPLFIQSQKPTALPFYNQQFTQKPSNTYIQNQPHLVVIPSKKPQRPNKRPTTTVQAPIYVQTEYPTQTPVQVVQVTGKPSIASSPVVIQTPSQQGHQFVTQPLQQQQVHQPVQVVTLPNHPQGSQHVQVVNLPNQQQSNHPIQILVQPNNEVKPQEEIYQIHPGQLDNPTDYEFNWFVSNEESRDYKSHREMRQNDIVQGQYEVLDPDGYRRIVSYTADELHGFRAVVRRIPFNAGYVQEINNNNQYFQALTTQRPFSSRGRKHALITSTEKPSTEKSSVENQS